MRRTFAVLLCLALAVSSVVTFLPVRAQVENTWVTKASMNVARSDLGVAVVNEKIYAIGGNTENGYMPNSHGNDYLAEGWITNANEEYDPAVDKWTLKNPMPTPRYSFAIASYGNRIYCMGGILNWVSAEITYTAINEVYDPATDSWETKTPMPIAVSAQAHVIDGKIYLIGGGSNETLNQVYDPATDSWTTKTSIPEALSRYGPINALSAFTSAVINNKIYAMSFAGASSINWMYNPSDDSWTKASSIIPLAGGNWWSQAAAATTGIMAPKRIFVFFARYPYSRFLPTFAYNPSAHGSCTTAANASIYRQNFAVAALNDILYVIGGRTYDYPFPGDGYFTVTEQALTEQYTPFGYGTPDNPAPSSSPSSLPSPTSSPPLSPSPTTPLLNNDQNPYSIIPVAAFSATLAALIVGLLLYLKNSKSRPDGECR